MIALAAADPDVAMAAPVKIVREAYRGWPNTYRLDNGRVEARVLTDVGPRIIDVRAAGGGNLFHVREREAGGNGEAEWVFRGGWRLWVAPERKETTYALDNSACQVEVVDGTSLRVTGPNQSEAGVRKQIEVSLDESEPRIRVTSRIRNITDRPLTYAAWSLPVMRPGGRAFVPLDVGPLDAFDAVRRVMLWSYAELADPRYRFGDRLVQIDQRRVLPAPAGQSTRRDDESKIGVDSAQGWAAYLNEGTLFLQRFPHQPGGVYPDGGATIEVYSSHEFLELEHLGPLTTIAPGEEIILPAEWWIFANARVADGEAEALADLRVYLDRTAEH
ncbi:MAG TPA: DUF4380 domain-containing protein [Candidatus Binatia bacterium]|nr:DUF4380 domain-containing protein [Candidatus Binatia bacterium]